MRAAAAAWLLASTLALGCRREAPNATPEGAVRELAFRLRGLDGSAVNAKAAFVLLAKETRDNLIARAERYSAASGKHIEPEMMLAPASFIEHYEAQRIETESHGEYALVKVKGLLPEQEAVIPCVREEGLWRVKMTLPPLPPVVTRPRDL